ncbi:MAG: 7-carboxy-7-deazaguanine synthase QueE [Bacteroidota bacterium]|nr:7-carboxy-7-deazaguanine synthase QueE [Bacteroidota bacterium]
MESFYTLQGEGMHSGKAAWFIRLGGCDVGCHWCDVKESWPVDAHPILPVTAIVAEAAKQPARLAVITGGEPYMHNLEPLITELHRKGFEVNIETSGAYPVSGSADWICLSPKKFKAPLPDVYNDADELKIIVFNKTDLTWAEEHAARVTPQCTLLLQPEWSRQNKMLPLIIDYIKQHPQWRVSLQTHKFMEIP